MLTDSTRHLLRTFLTGLLAALPLMATLAVCVWAARLVYEWFGPGSLIGQVLVAIGFGGVGSIWVSYLVGVLIVVLLIFTLGILVQTRLRRVISNSVDRIINRIPLVGKVYEMAKRFVDLLAQRDKSQSRSMSPVWLHFGGPGGAAVLGLLSTPEPVDVAGQAYVGVLVPTAPIPVGGGLLYVPQRWVTPAHLGVEAVTSIYVSMGITSKQHLGVAGHGIDAASHSATDPVGRPGHAACGPDAG